MIALRFNSPEEFAEELRKGPPADKILRVTKQFEVSNMHPTIRLVSVIGTFLNRDGQILRLQTYCGDYWGKEFGDKALTKAEKIMCELSELGRELNLEIRAGVYEELKK
jgi:hypothetical protein